MLMTDALIGFVRVTGNEAVQMPLQRTPGARLNERLLYFICFVIVS